MPTYLFLANLSSVTIYISSVTVSKMLVNHIVGSKSISYMGCVTQIYFFTTFINMDGFLLNVMVYDCHIAMCCPLYYTTIMRPRLCVLLVAILWVIIYCFPTSNYLYSHNLYITSCVTPTQF